MVLPLTLRNYLIKQTVLYIKKKIPHYNFNVKPIPPDIIHKDNFFKWLHARYDFIVGVLKLDPYTCYNWHTDTRRGVGVNMLLTPNTRSYCAFGVDPSQLVC
jgi:hypothetical protein